MGFKTTYIKTSSASTPELMYDDYKQKKVKELTSSQGVVVREYEKYIDKKDVALQLPTGSGKTLVGLVIGEWRRTSKNEKVLFLCPTRQLVKQVEEQASEMYGIPVTAYIGAKSQFSDEIKTNWRMNKTIAIATYSAFFNSGSFFEGADVVIFDDAHSAENYISKMWTLDIDEQESEGLFLTVSNVLKGCLTHLDYMKLTVGDGENDDWIDMLPGPSLVEVIDALVSAINVYFEANTQDSLVFSWRMIKNNLLACNIFMTRGKVSIRPFIPPTETYPLFNQLKQRIYMSATLGKGGELERITGVKSILRIKSPEKWETRAIGRRLVYFPELAFSEDKYLIVSNLIKCAGRALLMSSSDKTVAQFQEKVSRVDPSFKFINAKEFEEMPSSFLQSSNVILCFANRYDGLDLNGEKCRLLILDSISKILNLQDQFLSEKLLANDVFIDRITTRLTQAIGRCTRAENDYSLAYVIGDKLTDLYYDKRYSEYLNPEVQAEIKFGANESSHKDGTIDSFEENFKIFLNQGDEWREAEGVINKYRESIQRKAIAGEAELYQSVKHEVDFTYNLWKCSYTEALDNIKSILGCLSHNDLRGYRTFWNYYASYVCYLLFKNGDNESLKSALEYMKLASRSAIAINWFSRVAQQITPGVQAGEVVDDFEIQQLENMFDAFSRDGISHNRIFDRKISMILSYTANGESKKFERAQVELGRLLGFVSGKNESDASPDPWWVLDDKNIVVFEDNSESSPDGVLSATKARQAATHENWLRVKLKLDKSVNIHQVLITNKSKLSEGAHIQLKGAGVSLWDFEDYKLWVTNTLGIIRGARAEMVSGLLVARTSVLEKLNKNNLTAKKIVSHLNNLKL